MSRSIAGGVQAGVYATLGLGLGGLVYVVLGAIGLSQILKTSWITYQILKGLGVLYLFYLGVRLWRTPPASQVSPGAVSRHRAPKILLESAMVEITNPKTALFFLAFIPQFIDARAGHIGFQFFILGLLVTASALPCDLCVAFFAPKIAERMKHPGRERLQTRISGAILIAVATFIILSEVPALAAVTGSLR